MDRSEMVELVSRLSGEELRELNKIVIGSLRVKKAKSKKKVSKKKKTVKK